jgi:hypothetical protein
MCCLDRAGALDDCLVRRFLMLVVLRGWRIGSGNFRFTQTSPTRNLTAVKAKVCISATRNIYDR